MWNYFIQKILGPASFFRDFRDKDSYLKYNTFLPYINNEKTHPKMKQYKQKFEELNSLTLIKFIYDPVIYPIESSWFGEINPKGEIIPMEKTAIYQNNTFGLKTLNESGRIKRLIIEGVHLEFKDKHI